MPQFLQISFFNNTVLQYILFLASIIIGCVLIHFIGTHLLTRLGKITKKTNNYVDDIVSHSMKKWLVPIAYCTLVYMSTLILSLPPSLDHALKTGYLSVLTVLGALLVSSLAVRIVREYWHRKDGKTKNDLAIKLIAGIVNIVIWAVALLLFLDNIGVKITSLLAGIGIGGVAVAFAAQAVLSDLFCFLSISFDRPIEVGDFIVVGENMGTVERVGIKSTRLRAMTGEQLIISNTDLTSARINNYKRMEKRWVRFTIGVTFDTPSDTLQSIPHLIEGIIGGIADTEFDRTHFISFGASSLNFEVAYYVLSKEYIKYLNVHQQVNLGIVKEFEAQGIRLAFPTRTVHIKSESLLAMPEGAPSDGRS